MNIKNSFSVIDLFCGCGGLSLGFKRAGFDIIAGLDNDEASIKSFNRNIGDGYLFGLESNVWPLKLQEKINIDGVNVLIGGPPCQGYSLTGPRKFDDSRNKLYNAMFLGIEAFSPDIVLIENVRGMATLYDGKAKLQVIEELNTLGYNVETRILDAANFSVPQHRLRLFFIASRKGINFSWPEIVNTESNFITCGDALSDLPSMEDCPEIDVVDYLMDPQNQFQTTMRANSTQVHNHKITIHKPFVIETIRQVPEGGNYKDLPPGVGESRKFNEAWTRYHSKRPSKTIDTGHRNHFHYKYDRVPTIRENARLQSFPDNFIFEGSKTEQNRQVGNAVPVLLSQHLAYSILKALKNENS